MVLVFFLDFYEEKNVAVIPLIVVYNQNYFDVGVCLITRGNSCTEYGPVGGVCVYTVDSF